MNWSLNIFRYVFPSSYTIICIWFHVCGCWCHWFTLTHTWALLSQGAGKQEGIHKPVSCNTISCVNKNPTHVTVCRYLFTAKLLYLFRVSQHPSSGVLKTVPAASSTGHTTCTATPLLCGLIWRGVAVQVVWPVPEAVGIVFNTPDDGCCDTRNM